MSEINYKTEQCWKIPDGKKCIPLKISGSKVIFEPGTISYGDYEDICRAIDEARAFLPDGRRVSLLADLRDLPEKIDGQMVLHGKSASSYSYANGRCEIDFCNDKECIEHALRLQSKGLVALHAPEDAPSLPYRPHELASTSTGMSPG